MSARGRHRCRWAGSAVESGGSGDGSEVARHEGRRRVAPWDQNRRCMEGGGIRPKVTQHEERHQVEAVVSGGGSETQRSRLRALAQWVTSGGGGV
jgi:hypothetical protein